MGFWPLPKEKKKWLRIVNLDLIELTVKRDTNVWSIESSWGWKWIGYKGQDYACFCEYLNYRWLMTAAVSSESGLQLAGSDFNVVESIVAGTRTTTFSCTFCEIKFMKPQKYRHSIRNRNELVTFLWRRVVHRVIRTGNCASKFLKLFGLVIVKAFESIWNIMELFL